MDRRAARELGWRASRVAIDGAVVCGAVVARPVLRRVLPPPPTAGPRHDDIPFVFVVGFPRSGTTWVQYLLSARESTASATESNAYAAVARPLAASGSGIAGWTRVLYRYDRTERRDHGGLHHWVDRSTMRRLVVQGVVHPATSPLLDAQGVVEGVLDDFLARHPGATALVEKSPGHLHWARLILERFPTAKVVEVVRDGRDAIVSREALDRAFGARPQARRERAAQWRHAVATGDELRADPSVAGRVHRVRYEDLRTDPVPALTELLSFVGFDASPSVVDAALELRDFSVLQSEGNHHVRKAVVGDWRSVYDDRDRAAFWDVAGDVAAAAGYEP